MTAGETAFETKKSPGANRAKLKQNMSNETQQQVVVKSDPKPPVAFGSRGIEMRTLDDVYRFSKYISSSGFAPKGMDSPESLTVAIQLGMELGITPMSAVQNIAVINGRPAIWGDLVLALVRGSGQLEVFEEWLEQDGKRLDRSPTAINDSTAAFCRIKRTNFTPYTSSFSVADAKRANLWNKAGPWTQYPTRMLQMRARGFALRDQFGDALKGIMTAEEARDLPSDPVARAKNVTPSKQETAAEIQTQTNSADDDEIPMDHSTSSQVQSSPAVELAKPTETTISTPQQELENIVLKEGVNFDTFFQAAVAAGMLPAEPEPGSFDDIPSKQCEMIIASPRKLNAMLRAAKEVAK